MSNNVEDDDGGSAYNRDQLDNKGVKDDAFGEGGDEEEEQTYEDNEEDLFKIESDRYAEESIDDFNVNEDYVNIDGEEEFDGGEYDGEEEEEEPFVSIFDILDAPRELETPIDLNVDIVKRMQNQLGLITLCWPDRLRDGVVFEGRCNFPDSYLKNSDKEKLLLLYTENFRRQFAYKFPYRKPLFLSATNICDIQVSPKSKLQRDIAKKKEKREREWREK